MSTQLTIDASELRAEFKALLDSLHGAGEAGRIVEGTGNAATVDIKSAYTGSMRDKVKLTFSGSGFLSKAVVKQTSPLAWIFEHGTEARHYVTVNGVKHPTGKILPQHAFITRAIKHRRQMYVRLTDLLKRHGLITEGTV